MKTRYYALLSLSALGFLASSPADAQAPMNPGFETPALGTGNFQYTPSGASWTFAGGSGISNNSSGFTNGTPNAPQGTQVAFLQGNTSFSESLGFQGNVAYAYTIQASQRDAGGTEPSAEKINVLIDGTTILSGYQPGTSYATIGTSAFSFASNGFHTLTIQGVNSTGNDYTAFVDNVVTVYGVTNPITNGSFETPQITGTQVNGASPGGDYLYSYQAYNNGATTLQQQAGIGWTFNTQAGIEHNGSGFGATNAPDGTQAAFMQGTGAFSQSVTLPAHGVYYVSFDAAQRGSQAQNFSVTLNGVALNGCSNIKPTSSTFAAYTCSTNILSAGTYTLSFNGMDTVGGDNSAFIDLVNMNYLYTPAPSSLPTLLGGLSASAFWLRRRRNAGRGSAETRNGKTAR